MAAAAVAMVDIIFLLSLLIISVVAELPPLVDEGGGIDPTKTPVYIVHVREPLIQSRGGGGILSRSLRSRSLKNWYMSFLPNATLSSGEKRMVYTYRDVITGFAARLTADEAEAMEDKEGFITAYPEREHTAATTYTPAFLGLSQNPSSTLWHDTLMGAGQIIGVIDSGIKPNHPSFKDDGMPPKPTKWGGKCFWGNSTVKCNNKLIGAVGFRHGLRVSPLDNHGHGSHVASTAAGNFVDNANVINQATGMASGTAPRAHLAVYKVLFAAPSGEALGTDADILAGIEQAIRDKVDILQMSLGWHDLELFDSPVVIGSFSAMSKGIFPCTCMMNKGPDPSVLANDAPWMLTVGASTADRKITAMVLLGNGSEVIGESSNQETSLPSTQLPLVYPLGELNTDDAQGCHASELMKLNLTGKIVMCYRVEINDSVRGQNVLDAGGVGMILLNSWMAGETTNAEAHVLPTSQVKHTGMKLITDYYINGTTKPTATIQFRGTQFNNNPAPGVAVFSSRGPSLVNGGIIKPDVIAPGVNILAAWPHPVGPTGSIFNFYSGTSMATPHVSGVVAMLKNKHPTWSPAAIQSAIMTTAYTLNREGNPITDEFEGDEATVFERGAGHIDAVAAADPGLIYQLTYSNHVDYLCGLYNKSNHKVQMIAGGTVDCAQVKGIESEQLNYPSFGITLGGGKTTMTVERLVTNVGDTGSEYTVNVVEPEGVRVVVTPKTLKFSHVGEELTYDVEFSLKGGLPAPVVGEAKDGRLSWVSGKYLVSSPIAVTFD